jgi:cyclopropane fatty-acyl-phospholipid synthase-like methyltransferase
MNRRRVLLAGLAALAGAPGCSTPGIKLDAPYVSTPEPVVKAMLELAAVRRDDVVYDLGCGDGRIVIAAARDFGARGVGIDIDPRRIEEANAAARSAGVAGRVRFAVQDLFTTDFSEATVIALYLYPELNERLAPKLRRELRPGARIVAHQFGIKSWAPDRSDSIWDGRAMHQIFGWTVPPR